MTPERLDQTWNALDATEPGDWLAAQVQLLVAEARAATDPARAAALLDDAAALCDAGLGDRAEADALWAEAFGRQGSDPVAAWAVARAARARGDRVAERAALDALLHGLPEGEVRLWAQVPLAAHLQDFAADAAGARALNIAARRHAPRDPALVARATALADGDEARLAELFAVRLNATASAAHRARLRVEQGARHEASGDLDAAVLDYEAALAADPASVVARDRLVRVRVAQGADAELVTALVIMAADLPPGTARSRARHLAGMICISRLGDAYRGEALLRLSAEDPQPDPVTARELARLALTAEGASDAFGSWAADPDPAEAALGAWLQATALARVGDVSGAHDTLGQALATADPPALSGGRLLLHLARRRLGSEGVDRVFFDDTAALWDLAAGPADRLALATAAGLQAERADDPEATDAWYAQALTSAPADPQAPSATLRARIGAFWARGAFEAARDALDAALAQGGGPSTRHWLHRRLAELAVAQCPDSEAALRHLRALLTLEPGHGWGGRAYEHLLDARPPAPDEAPLVRTVAEAAQGERRASLLVRAGNLFAAGGNQDQAERCWQAALDAVPDFLPARTALGAALAGRGAWAEVAALEVVSLDLLPPDDPGRAEVAERLANLRDEHLNDHKGAITAHTEVLRHRADHVAAWLARIAAAERARDEATLEGLALAVRARGGDQGLNAGLLTRIGTAALAVDARALAVSALVSAVEAAPESVLAVVAALSLATRGRDGLAEQRILRAALPAAQRSAPEWAPILAHRLAQLLPPVEARALLATRIDEGEVDAAWRSARLACVAGDVAAAARDLGRLGGLLPPGSQDAIWVLRTAAELAERAGLAPVDRASFWERVLAAAPETARAWEGLFAAFANDPAAEAAARVRFARTDADPRARAHALLIAGVKVGPGGAEALGLDPWQEAIEADPQGISALWMSLDPGVDLAPPTPMERVAALTTLAGRLRRPRDQAMALAEAASLQLEAAGRPERAGAWLMEAVRRDPSDPLLAERALAWARPRSRHVDVAEILRLRMGELEDGLERRRLHRVLAGVLIEGLRDRASARAEWEVIAAAEPGAVDAPLALGDLCYGLEDFAAAEGHYAEALERPTSGADRRHAAVRLARLRVLRRASVAEVEAVLAGLLDEDADGALRSLLAEAQRQAGDPVAAAATLAPLAEGLTGEARTTAQGQRVAALLEARTLDAAERSARAYLAEQPDEPLLVAALESVLRALQAEVEPEVEVVQADDVEPMLVLDGGGAESAADALAALEGDAGWVEAPWVEADFGAAFADDDRSHPPSLSEEEPVVVPVVAEGGEDTAFEWTGALDDPPRPPSAAPPTTTVLSAGQADVGANPAAMALAGIGADLAAEGAADAVSDAGVAVEVDGLADLNLDPLPASSPGFAAPPVPAHSGSSAAPVVTADDLDAEPGALDLADDLFELDALSPVATAFEGRAPTVTVLGAAAADAAVGAAAGAAPRVSASSATEASGGPAALPAGATGTEAEDMRALDASPPVPVEGVSLDDVLNPEDLFELDDLPPLDASEAGAAAAAHPVEVFEVDDPEDADDDIFEMDSLPPADARLDHDAALAVAADGGAEDADDLFEMDLLPAVVSAGTANPSAKAVPVTAADLNAEVADLFEMDPLSPAEMGPGAHDANRAIGVDTDDDLFEMDPLPQAASGWAAMAAEVSDASEVPGDDDLFELDALPPLAGEAQHSLSGPAALHALGAGEPSADRADWGPLGTPSRDLFDLDSLPSTAGTELALASASVELASAGAANRNIGAEASDPRTAADEDDLFELDALPPLVAGHGAQALAAAGATAADARAAGADDFLFDLDSLPPLTSTRSAAALEGAEAAGGELAGSGLSAEGAGLLGTDLASLAGGLGVVPAEGEHGPAAVEAADDEVALFELDSTPPADRHLLDPGSAPVPDVPADDDPFGLRAFEAEQVHAAEDASPTGAGIVGQASEIVSEISDASLGDIGLDVGPSAPADLAAAPQFAADAAPFDDGLGLADPVDESDAFELDLGRPVGAGFALEMEIDIEGDGEPIAADFDPDPPLVGASTPPLSDAAEEGAGTDRPARRRPAIELRGIGAGSGAPAPAGLASDTAASVDGSSSEPGAEGGSGLSGPDLQSAGAEDAAAFGDGSLEVEANLLGGSLGVSEPDLFGESWASVAAIDTHSAAASAVSSTWDRDPFDVDLSDDDDELGGASSALTDLPDLIAAPDALTSGQTPPSGNEPVRGRGQAPARSGSTKPAGGPASSFADGTLFEFESLHGNRAEASLLDLTADALDPALGDGADGPVLEIDLDHDWEGQVVAEAAAAAPATATIHRSADPASTDAGGGRGRLTPARGGASAAGRGSPGASIDFDPLSLFDANAADASLGAPAESGDWSDWQRDVASAASLERTLSPPPESKPRGPIVEGPPATGVRATAQTVPAASGVRPTVPQLPGVGARPSVPSMPPLPGAGPRLSAPPQPSPPRLSVPPLPAPGPRATQPAGADQAPAAAGGSLAGRLSLPPLPVASPTARAAGAAAPSSAANTGRATAPGGPLASRAEPGPTVPAASAQAAQARSATARPSLPELPRSPRAAGDRARTGISGQLPPLPTPSMAPRAANLGAVPDRTAPPPALSLPPLARPLGGGTGTQPPLPALSGALGQGRRLPTLEPRALSLPPGALSLGPRAEAPDLSLPPGALAPPLGDLATRAPAVRVPADRVAAARAIIGRDALDLKGWRGLADAAGGDPAVEAWLADVIGWVEGAYRPAAPSHLPGVPVPETLRRGLLPEAVPGNLLLLLRSVAGPLGSALAGANPAAAGRRLGDHEPLSGLVRQISRCLDLGKVQPQLTDDRPYSVLAQAGDPVLLVMGTALFEGADTAGAGFLVARALGPVAEGTLAARALSDREFRAFLSALFDLLGVRVPTLARDRSTIDRLQGWLEPHLPLHQRLSWEPLAQSAVSGMSGRSAASLRAGLEVYAARLAAALADGFGGAMEMLRLLDFDDRPRDRIGTTDLQQFVADNDVARDLLVFAASDACFKVRRWRHSA